MIDIMRTVQYDEHAIEVERIDHLNHLVKLMK